MSVATNAHAETTRDAARIRKIISDCLEWVNQSTTKKSPYPPNAAAIIRILNLRSLVDYWFIHQKQWEPRKTNTKRPVTVYPEAILSQLTQVLNPHLLHSEASSMCKWVWLALQGQSAERIRQGYQALEVCKRCGQNPIFVYPDHYTYCPHCGWHLL